MDKVKLRIGISMRSVPAENYDEPRDAIARDWSTYIQKMFPEALWLFIPNIGDEVTDYIKNWGINRIILSGGEDYGTDKLRDNTEEKLYHFALENEIPLLGVCRGFQLICKLNDLEVKKSEEVAFRHTATHHNINFLEKSFNVNSYHSNYIDSSTAAKKAFDQIGLAEDNTIEAVLKNKVMGIMWHPERQNNEQKITDSIIKKFLQQ